MPNGSSAWAFYTQFWIHRYGNWSFWQIKINNETRFFTYRSVQPQFIGNFVYHLSTSRASINDDDSYGMRAAYINGVSIIICSVLMILINHPFNLYMVKWGMEIRLVCCSMIYRKVRNAIAMVLFSLLRLWSDFRFYACQKQMFSMVSMARCWIWCQLMSRSWISRCS